MPTTTPPAVPLKPNYKLIGQNYTTPDLVAKVTGRAKYAEDYRAEGMLFAKLLLSPMPHAHVRSIDASEALAMPGVKAILTVDDLPAPADAMTDLGQVIPANKLGERGLTNDPVYQGEPILAVCAVDEYTCAEAIEKIHIEYDRLPHVVDPLVTLRPGAANARVEATSGFGQTRRLQLRASHHRLRPRHWCRSSSGLPRISRMPRTASSPWARPPIIGHSAIGRRGSRTPTWYWTKLS
jgi:CO/xanthine dehydrogenase Mo-binding subunit